MKRATWLDLVAGGERSPQSLTPEVRGGLAKLDDRLFELWNLGENVLLAWTHQGKELRFVAVRHYAITEAVHGPASAERPGETEIINETLAGPKQLAPAEFDRVCRAFEPAPFTIGVDSQVCAGVDAELVTNLVRRYGVSLVRGRAVVLLDAVQFSLSPPLEQVAMLNSLAYSVNSAYRQLLSKDIHINFARTTTGDGFYIWNRAKTLDANTALYKLMMMILADNAVAQTKSRGSCVPRLRAAFHVGEHYEFHQVEALNPTTFSYIVGQVTIDLSRMIEKGLPGQILLGDFKIEAGGTGGGETIWWDTLDFVENTAATLDQLEGLVVSGDRIEKIRCYLTGQGIGSGRFPVNRYRIQDKHGTTRSVYNAKINIHRQSAEPIYLGIQHEGLSAFPSADMDVLRREPV